MVNSDWEFLEIPGIPNYYNSGSKSLEIPKNSQKFPEFPRNSRFIANRTWNSWEFLGIPTQSANDFPWKAVNLKNS